MNFGYICITNVLLSCSVLGKFGILLCVESDSDRQVSFSLDWDEVYSLNKLLSLKVR